MLLQVICGFVFVPLIIHALVYRIFGGFNGFRSDFEVEEKFKQSSCAVFVERFVVASTLRRLHTRRATLRTPALTDDVERR